MSTIKIGLSLPPHASQDVEDVRKAFVRKLKESEAGSLIEVEPVEMRSAALNELFVTIQSGAHTVKAVGEAALVILLVCRQIRELYKDVKITVQSSKLYKPEDIDKIDQEIAEKLLKND
jgi:hypothetical protein